MKTNKIIFRTTTALIAAGFLMSAVMYLTQNPKITEGFATLGYPPYMIYILGIAKLLAAIGLLQPLSLRAREWAYAGSAFVLMGATVSHLAMATPFVAPLAFLAILGTSWVYNNKLNPATAV